MLHWLLLHWVTLYADNDNDNRNDKAAPRPSMNAGGRPKFQPAVPIEPLIQLDNDEGSTISLDKTDRELNNYNRALELIATDQTYQREISMGKRIAFYRLGRELGSGNFSKVRLGIHVLTKEKVAVKVMERTKMDQKSLRLLQREIQNMEEMHHPNIVRLFEVVETLSKLYLVLEFAGGGELYQYVIQKERLRESEAKKIYAQVLAAVVHMHEKAIIHRDIKAENVFFAAPGFVKLGDFGFSVEVEPGSTLKTFCGSPPYAAPELFKDQEYHGEYVDIWALGILLYFLVVGNTPFRGETVSELKKQILDGYFTIPDTVTPFCRDLINGILVLDPMQRYTFGDIMDHYWLTSVNFPEADEPCPINPDEKQLETNAIVPVVFEKVESYGITRDMLKQAAGKGAKNALVGVYRIVTYMVQQADREKEALERAQNGEDGHSGTTGAHTAAGTEVTDARSLMTHVGKRASKLCAIL